MILTRWGKKIYFTRMKLHGIKYKKWTLLHLTPWSQLKYIRHARAGFKKLSFGNFITSLSKRKYKQQLKPIVEPRRMSSPGPKR